MTLSMSDPTKKPRKIDPVAIRKGNFNVYPEADEGYPALYSDKRGMLQQLMGMAAKDPALAAALDDPANQAWIKAVFGLSELTLAGESSRQKQLKEIDDMLQGQEVQIGPLDRDAIHVEVITEWSESEAGMSAELEDGEAARGIAPPHAFPRDAARRGTPGSHQEKRNAAGKAAERIDNLRIQGFGATGEGAVSGAAGN